MSNINYISAIVKILEVPKQEFIANSNIFVIRFRAQLRQVRKNQNRVVKLVIWGNLASSFLQSYKVYDYILIEGYTSLREKITARENILISNSKNRPLKQVTITVVKVHPLLLNSNRLINKLS